MQIRKIKIQGFRSHVKTEIEGLGRYTVFMGSNGAGKSTIIDAIRYALTGTCRGTDDAGRGADGLGTGGAGQYAITLDTDKGVLTRSNGQGPRSQAHGRIAKATGLDQGLARVLAQPSQFMQLAPAEQKALLMSFMAQSLSEAEVGALLGELINAPGQGKLLLAALTTLDGVNELERQVRERRPLLKHDLQGCVYVRPEQVPGVEASPEILKECEDELRQLQTELANKTAAASNELTRIQQLKARLGELEARGLQIDARIDTIGDKAGIEQAVAEMRGRLGAADAAAKERAEQIQTIEREISEAQATSRIIKEQAQKLQTLKGSCPTCTQGVPPEYVKDAVATLKAKYDRLAKGVRDHQEQVNTLRQIGTEQGPDAIRENLAALQQALTELHGLHERHDEIVRDHEAVSKQLKGPRGETATSQELDELRGRIDKGTRYVSDVRLLLEERAKEEAIGKKRQLLQDQLRWVEAMVELLGAKGPIRAKLLGGGLGPLLAELNVIAKGLQLPEVGITIEPWQLTVGGLPAVMMSESELYRVSLAFAGVFAKRSGAGILCLDGADILDEENRGLMADVLEAAGLDQAIIAATGPLPETTPADGEWKFYLVRKRPDGVSAVVDAAGVAA